MNRAEELAGFDAVFGAVFGGAVLGLDPVGLTSSLSAAETRASASHVAGVRATDSGGLPWTTRPASIVAADRPDSAESEVALPDLLPSRLAARADEPRDCVSARFSW